MTTTAPPLRILVAKPGLDGHDRGAKYVAHILRDAGFEVIYTGIRRTPEQIVRAAIQEDVRAIGVSLLSGAHEALVKRIMSQLQEQDAADIAVFVGGTISPQDAQMLQASGVKDVFFPGTSAAEIVSRLRRCLAPNEDSRLEACP